MHTKWVCLLLLASMYGLAGSAQSVSISPTTLVLDGKNQIDTVTIRNQADHESIYELAGYRWTQRDEQDVLTLDKAFVVTPPVITLAPGQERVVRVGLLPQDAPASLEHAYRLRISELAAPTAGPEAGLNVRLQLLLPIFSPGRDRDLALDFSAKRESDGSLCVVGDNIGTTHAKLVWIAAAGDMDRKTPLQKYILAGKQGTMCTDASLDMGEKLTIGVTSAYEHDIFPYEISVSAP